MVYHSDRISADADLYYIDFKNKLQSFVDPVTKETVQYNLGGAIYKGIEGEVTFMANEHLFLFANGSINRARTVGVNTTTPATLVVVGGKQIAKAPKGTAAFGALVRWGGLSVSLMDKYTGVQWAAEGEPDAYRIAGYHSADLKLVYSFSHYRLEAAVYNLTNSQQATAITPGKTVPYDQYYFQPARSFQLTAKATF